MVAEANGSVSDSGVTSTESAAPVVSDTTTTEPVVEASSEPAVNPAVDPATPPVPVVAAPPAYTPNLRYKAFQEEKQFPEWTHKLITSKEHEDQMRSLFCKADGLDGLKPKYQELRTAHADVQGRLDTLGKLRKEDLHGFFEACGIERKELVDFIIKSDEIMRDPARKEAWEGQRAAQKTAAEVQQRFEQQQQHLDHMAANHHHIQMQTVTNDPDVAAFGKAFDAKLGEGAFMAHIYNVGNSHFLENQKNLSPAEATAMVIRQYHRLVADSATPTAPVNATVGTSSDGMPVVPPVKPIPNLGNGSVNTGKPKIRNLDDLYKRADQVMSASQ